MNKRNIVLVLSLLFLINGFIYAQNFNLKYYSSISDGYFENNYSGVALAQYYNSSEINSIEKRFETIGRNLDKLTKNNYWLCWKALNEWDIEDNETYLVIIASSLASNDCILLLVTIENSGKSFSWRGKTISMDDLKQPQKLENNYSHAIMIIIMSAQKYNNYFKLKNAFVTQSG